MRPTQTVHFIHQRSFLERPCAQCGTTFRPHKTTQRFCTPSCRVKGDKYSTCILCFKPFQVAHFFPPQSVCCTHCKGREEAHECNDLESPTLLAPGKAPSFPVPPSDLETNLDSQRVYFQAMILYRKELRSKDARLHLTFGERTCLGCGSRFMPRKRDQLRCKYGCSKAPLPERICRICREEFRPVHEKQTACWAPCEQPNTYAVWPPSWIAKVKRVLARDGIAKSLFDILPPNPELRRR